MAALLLLASTISADIKIGWHVPTASNHVLTNHDHFDVHPANVPDLSQHTIKVSAFYIFSFTPIDVLPSTRMYFSGVAIPISCISTAHSFSSMR